MQIKTEDREYFISKITKSFPVSKRRAEKLITDLQRFIDGKGTVLVHDIAYAVYYYNDKEFLRASLQQVAEFFTYLYHKEYYAIFREELISVYSRFQGDLLLQMLEHAHRIEDKDNTTRKILLHTSERLGKTLDIQELMIASISHEMRTSLNAIYGYITMIDDTKVLKGEEKDYLAKADNATVVLKSLVSDILNVTKINSGQIEIIKDKFWLDEMAIKAIDNISIELKNKPNIILNSSIDFLSKKVYGDQNHILEILINLLSNAVKYTDEGDIELTIQHKELSDDYIEVIYRVKDSGIGIKQDQIDYIFTPYSRFQKDRNGLGLGLHIAKELSKKLKGTLTVESEFGIGSLFTLTTKLKIIQEHKINLIDKNICFLNSQEHGINFKKKVTFLKDNGANVKVFTSETKFINQLLTLKDIKPHFISILADNDSYTKFDALLYYLKTLDLFHDTVFIAEKTNGDISLKYFDYVYDHIAPVSVYDAHIKTESLLENSSKDSINILVIDDTETNLEILKMFIIKIFSIANVDIATGGYEGIGMYKIKKYDLVFLDLKMPGLDGFKVLERLRSINSTPIIYAFTADVYKSNFDKVKKSGFSGLLEKPVQPEILEKIIRGVINEEDN